MISNMLLTRSAKCWNCFKQRLTLDNPRFVERYINGELHFWSITDLSVMKKT